MIPLRVQRVFILAMYMYNIIIIFERILCIILYDSLLPVEMYYLQ